MVGKYDIVLYNNKVQYQLTVKRNITVLRGDSASGKSELIRLLSLYNSNPESSGITLICEKTCTVLTEENWELFMQSYSQRIFFIDEGNSFLKTNKFAESVKGADNYFVIISRESLPQLPYAVEEIYGLREGDAANKYREAKKIYNEMYNIYSFDMIHNIRPKELITEDSNSGYEFFDKVFKGKTTSAHGKSNIKKELAKSFGTSKMAVVDGAAFGPEMQECMELINVSGGKLSLYAPESFEYLILKSQILKVARKNIEETWNFADSKEYVSWEDYYTKLLVDKTKGEVYKYNKKSLKKFYTTAGSIEKMKRVLPDCLKYANLDNKE